MPKELNFDGFTFAGVVEAVNLDYFFGDDESLDGAEYGVVIDTATVEELSFLDDADVYSVIEDIKIPVRGFTPELVAVPMTVDSEEYAPARASYPRARGRKTRRQLREAVKKTSFQEVVHGKFGRPVGVK